MTAPTNSYRITQPVTGVVLGIYEGADEAAAVDAMARDAGYVDTAEMDGVTGDDSMESLMIEEVTLRTFIDEASSRETDEAVMRAIAAEARDYQHAVALWDDGPADDEQSARIVRTAMEIGGDPEEMCWGDTPLSDLIATA